MSTALRTLSKHARTLSALSHVAPRSGRQCQARSFHSPFAMLSKREPSPASKPPAPVSAGIYEKNIQYDAEPFLSGAGHRTYVVSTPDPANTPYEVPSGAFPTSAPYQSYTRTEAPVRSGAQFASTSTGFAHPLTNKVPHTTTASGGQVQKGSEGELPDVNPPPLFENAERFSKAGVDNAWKERK
ncbi:hypothetical protein GSI_02416 [Ganoderma sinense ZZ0214-1]|uniref:Uncharacterized protein n=1 Tax=Ganoderma sinense ZZ0214-1 TaxID=1077348 RepID=A0A2G8SPI8_9APHY|nr:hypothetical protein GSI_02416 [Ganoderma sinense ZZ0214-1]